MSLETKQWWVECGANIPSGGFTRNHMMTSNKVNSFRYKWDNVGVFATAYMYDCEDRTQANLYGDFYLDLDYDIQGSEDPEKGFNVIRSDARKVIGYLKVIFRIPNDNIKIYFSGSKGIHIIVPKEVLGVVPDKNLNRIYRMIAEDIKKSVSAETVDLKIYDNKRLFRLPNSVHPKTQLYKIFISYNELETLTFADMKKLASSPRAEGTCNVSTIQHANNMYRNYISRMENMKSKTRTYTAMEKLDYTPPCIEYLLNNPVGEGQRNSTLAFMASFYKQAGYTIDEAFNELMKWNNNVVSPTIEEQEVQITVNSIYNGDHKMGCSTATIISRCDKKTCKFQRGKY